MLAMVIYPDIQEKARREIDSVIGLGRLPDFNDRGSLPYIDAVVKEGTILLRQVLPRGFLVTPSYKILTTLNK